MARTQRWSHVAVAIMSMTIATTASAQTAANVAVIINENSADSIAVGEYYAKARALPAGNIFRIRTSTAEEIDREAYSNTIETPLIAALASSALQDRILYLVLTKGVPLRVAGTRGAEGTIASVDSELTLLYRVMTGAAIVRSAHVDNPYYLGERDIGEARPFSHREHDIYLVSRLDGFSLDDARALVERSLRATREGAIELPQGSSGGQSVPAGWRESAASRLKGQGFGDRLAGTSPDQRMAVPALAYFASPTRQRLPSSVEFAHGAIATIFTGGDARTFAEPPAAWRPGTPYAGALGPLVGDLVRAGVTGASASVAEPLIGGAIRPQVLFPAYFAGFNLVEAFYLATPRLSWQTVVIGDPLTAPFRSATTAAADREVGEDPITLLPDFYSRRRVAMMVKQTGLPERALALGLRGENLALRGDRAAARAAFEEAVAVAPRHSGALMRLGQMDEGDGAVDAATAKYRQVLDLDPANVIALNNLAYATAVRLRRPAEALPLAERAAKLAPQNGGVLDTLAWVQHLIGDSTAAGRTIAQAIERAPDDAELRLHAAFIFAALGNGDAARRQLQEAARIDAAVLERQDVRKLQAGLSSP